MKKVIEFLKSNKAKSILIGLGIGLAAAFNTPVGDWAVATFGGVEMCQELIDSQSGE